MSENNYVNMINFALFYTAFVDRRNYYTCIFILFIILSTKITRSGRRDRGGGSKFTILGNRLLYCSYTRQNRRIEQKSTVGKNRRGKRSKDT